MNAVDVIRIDRDGGRIPDDAIRWFLQAYTAGEIPDEQASALLMAILFQGMADDELATWTAAMIDSGERLDLSAVGRPTVDNHSTGGVGDKVWLRVAPIIAACGVIVPQLSGAGFGHTGGDPRQAGGRVPAGATSPSPRDCHPPGAPSVACSSAQTGAAWRRRDTSSTRFAM